MPLPFLSEEARAQFEAGPASAGVVGWPELGSRAMQRLALAFTGDGTLGDHGWIEVQPGRYRYMAVAEGSVVIRIVLSEYLACEVVWE